MGTAERHKSMPKVTGVKANRTLDAVPDGAFAVKRMNVKDVDQSLVLVTNSRAARTVIHFVAYILAPAPVVTVSCASR